MPSRRAQGNDAGIATPGHLADQPAARRALRGHGARVAAALVAFWRKAYTDGITGLAAMIAYNLLLSIFPLALIALVASIWFGSSFWGALDTAFCRIYHVECRKWVEQKRFALVMLVVSVYVSTSFWGALDTAFCRIYHSECRSWVRQKLFALSMLVVVLLFFAASVTVPAAQSLLTTGTKDLPFGLSDVRGLVRVLTVLAGLLVLFATLCVVYWRVPRGAVPWRSIWPGALLATLAMGVVDYGFPLYLNNVSTLAEVGPSVVFALIVLIWFYALAI
ncbi:MAG: rane protein, partial [Baekduia sp.]|nr:rane protein [Baekduia sp.]